MPWNYYHSGLVHEALDHAPHDVSDLLVDGLLLHVDDLVPDGFDPLIGELGDNFTFILYITLYFE